MQRNRDPRRILGAYLLLAALLFSGCGAGKGPSSGAPVQTTPAPVSVPTPTAEPETPAPAVSEAPRAQETSSPTPAAVETAPPATAEPVSALDEIRALIDEGFYYEAFRDMQAFEEANDDPDGHAACEALFYELDSLLQAMEPESGTELERSISVQGGGILEISAWSGPVVVTAIDAAADPQENPAPDFVRFYVRQGELGSVLLPPGTYRILYQVGYRWFGDEIGFGEYCTEGELEEPLLFEFRMEGSWPSNSKYTITL